MGDLITHDWRTWDHVQAGAAGFPTIQSVIRAANAKVFSAFHKWGAVDPLYTTMVETFPNPDIKR
jgi:hypothetical protein